MKTYNERYSLVLHYEDLCDQHIKWSRDYTMLLSSRIYHEEQARKYRDLAEHYRNEL